MNENIEEIGREWNDHFRGFYNAAAIRGVDVGWEQHEKWLRTAMTSLLASHQKATVEGLPKEFYWPSEVVTSEGNLKYRDGWNAYREAAIAAITGLQTKEN